MTLTSDSPASITAARGLSVAIGGGQRIITGTGFGAGPTVVLFDRFAGQDREVLSATRQADVGQWANKGGASGYDARLYEDRGRTWFAHRDPEALGVSTTAAVWMFFATQSPVSEFRFAHRRWVPTDRHFPGATAPGEYDTNSPSSSWKPTWAAGSNGSDLSGIESNDGQADLVFDSHIFTGSMKVTGNSVQPESQAGGGFYTGFSFTAPTLTTWYQSGVESSEGAYDQIVDRILVHDGASVRETRNDVDTFRANADTWSTMSKAYQGWRLGGLITNGVPYNNAMPLIADFYLAVGENSRACIITGDAATLSSCTEAYIVPPDSWSDTEIKYTPAGHESLPYTHIITFDGSLIENAEHI